MTQILLNRALQWPNYGIPAPGQGAPRCPGHDRYAESLSIPEVTPYNGASGREDPTMRQRAFESQRLLGWLLPAMVLSQGLQLLRVFIPSLAWYLRDTQGLSSVSLLPYAFGTFLAGYAAARVRRGPGARIGHRPARPVRNPRSQLGSRTARPVRGRAAGRADRVGAAP